MGNSKNGGELYLSAIQSYIMGSYMMRISELKQEKKPEIIHQNITIPNGINSILKIADWRGMQDYETPRS